MRPTNCTTVTVVKDMASNGSIVVEQCSGSGRTRESLHWGLNSYCWHWEREKSQKNFQQSGKLVVRLRLEKVIFKFIIFVSEAVFYLSFNGCLIYFFDTIMINHWLLIYTSMNHSLLFLKLSTGHAQLFRHLVQC